MSNPIASIPCICGGTYEIRMEYIPKLKQGKTCSLECTNCMISGVYNTITEVLCCLGWVLRMTKNFNSSDGPGEKKEK